MPTRSLPATHRCAVVLLVTLALSPGVAPASRAVAQQQPVAVLAVSGLDPLLEDIDYLFAAGEAPQHARKLREILTMLNELHGLDRQRPLGVYLYLPAAGEQDPQPLLFFPVSDIRQLQASLDLGDELQLRSSETSDRLILHTDDGDLPVHLQHGFAFIDPTKSGVRFGQPLPDPMPLIAESLAGRDGVLLIRREGLPPALIELALGHLRTEALKVEPQKEGESDADFAFRIDVHNAVFALMESAVQEWQGATLCWRMSSEHRAAHVEATIQVDPDGRTADFLQNIRGGSGRFASQRQAGAAVSLALNWQPTPSGREQLEDLVASIREQTTKEVADAGEEVRQAVFGTIDALEATATEETSESFLQLQQHTQGRFLLLGGTSVADADKFAVGLQRLLPFAAESADIREITLNVARAGDVAIHRLRPEKLRKRDQRLYGEDAVIYLAAGRAALWVAVGGEGTADQLARAILLDELPRETVHARPASLAGALPTGPTGPALVDLIVDAGEWVDLARTQGVGPDHRVADLARRALGDSDDDRLRLWVQPDEQGLGIHLHLEGGYTRLLGMLLADRMNRP